MTILEIKTNEKQYLPLLLLADEQENMIDCYLERGTMYVLDDDGVQLVDMVYLRRSLKNEQIATWKA